MQTENSREREFSVDRMSAEYFRKFTVKQFLIPDSVGDPAADAGEQELRRKHRIQFLNLFIRAVKPQFSVIEDTALPGKGIGKE
jgi:hypothetical protein